MQILQYLDVGSIYKALTSNIFTLTCTKPRFRALFAEVDFKTSTLRIYIYTYTFGSVPYATCSLAFLIYILGFKDTISVKAYLLLLNIFNL
jgi:hypothetical protein